MAPQSQDEKKVFFQGLEALDDLSESDNEHLNPSKGADFKRPQLPQKTARRTRVEAGSAPKPTPALRKAATTAGVLTTTSSTTSRKSTSRPASTTSSSRGLKRAKSDTASTRKSAKRKMESKGKSDPQVQPREQFFAGLRLFFIPNRGLATLRKKQIARAEQHGADIVYSFDDDVTHIITDSKWELTHVLKELPGGRRPKNIPMITELWVVDCFQNHALRSYDQSRFFVSGTLPLIDANGKDGNKNDQQSSKTTLPPVPTPLLDADPVNPPLRFSQVFSPERHLSQSTEVNPNLNIVTNELTSEPDELDELLQQPSDSNMRLVEDLVRSDPSFKFEGDYDFDAASTTLSFSCAHKHELGAESDNPNLVTIRLLKHMASVYEDTNEPWRARAFKRAATTLSREKVLITTKDQAEKLPNIGASIAEKIEEIVLKGSLGRLDQAMSDPRIRTLHLFMGIYGVGHRQASAWVEAGYTSLEQVVEHATLTSNQQIGIDHYEDFQTRVPRDEVTQHAQIVRQALDTIDPSLEMIVGGSYRRGSPDSGDIDILITKEFAEMCQIRTVVQQSLIPQLKQQGFIVAELASGHHGAKEDDSSKWMGACVLPGSTIWRRLDLLFVPWAELGAALIYWTGNDFFNRSLRLLASRRNMRLNQHGLYKDVMRGKGRVKLTEGELVESHSEKKIFECLGVAYRPPHHRLP